MLAFRFTSHHDPHLAARQCVTFVFLHNSWFIASAKVFYMALCAIDQDCLRFGHPINLSFVKSGGASAFRWFDPDKFLNFVYITSDRDSLGSTPFMCCSYWYIPFAGALNGVSLSLGVALYQYTNSTIEQRNLTAIFLTVRWPSRT